MTNNGKDDPTPHPVDIPEKELADLVANISLQARDRLRKLQEDLNAVGRAIEERGNHVMEQVASYANDSRSAIDVFQVICDNTDNLKDRMKLITATVEPPKPHPLQQMQLPRTDPLLTEEFNKYAPKRRPNNEPTSQS